MMSEPYVLLTTAEIDVPSFGMFMASVGAEIELDDPTSARLSKGRRHIWIYLNPESIDNIDSDIIASIVSKLGARPINSLVLELSSEPETDKLVIDLAIKFCEKWNAILEDYTGAIFDINDLKRLRREGKGLPLYADDDL